MKSPGSSTVSDIGVQFSNKTLKPVNASNFISPGDQTLVNLNKAKDAVPKGFKPLTAISENVPTDLNISQYKIATLKDQARNFSVGMTEFVKVPS